jgi:hypothetical protein
MRISRTLFTLFVPLLLSACGGDTNGTADTGADSVIGDTTPDDDTGDDAVDDTAGGDTTPAGDTSGQADTADAADATGPPPALAATRYGARIWGPIVQLSRTGRSLWIGTRGVPVPEDVATIRAGLYRYDLDSGAVRVFEAELPHDAYYDFGEGVGQLGPVPTAAVHQDVDRQVVVALTGLLTLQNGAFQDFPITLPGGGDPVIPTHVAIARDGLRPVAWMTTSAGLLRLNEDTFAVESVIASPEEGVTGAWGDLTVDPDTGDCYAAFYPTDPPSRIVRATVGGAVTSFVPGTDGTPEGRVGQLVWSQADQATYAAIGGWAGDKGGVLRWDGTTAATVVTEGQLSKAATGEVGAFGAQTLALDDTRHVLAVGGQILGNPVGPTKGGGLAWVDLTGTDQLAAVHSDDTPLVAIHVSSMVIDSVSGRTFAALSGLCSETRLRASGLWALSFDDVGKLRLERPLLSGVRGIATTAGGPVQLGLRDDNGGLACDGYPIQQGLVRLEANGAGRLEPVHTSEASTGLILTAPSITALERQPGGELAIGCWKDSVFYGPPEAGVAENPTTWRTSLYVEDVARVETAKGPALWIASRATHSTNEPPNLANVGPDGAARVGIDDKGGFAGFTHFVRDSSRPEDVKGLPSSDVRAVLPDTDGSVILACARERVDASFYDRVEEPAFLLDGAEVPGGVVRVAADDTLSAVTTSAQTPDPRALAWDASGALLVADAEVGVVRVTEGGVEALDLGGSIPSGAVPRALWAGPGDDLVVGFDRGVYARIGGATLFVDTVGFTWTIEPFGPGVLVGSDEGLVAIAPENTTWTGLEAVQTASPIPFAEVTLGGGSGGDCLEASAVCSPGGTPCCAGLSCGGSGFVTMCQ